MLDRRRARLRLISAGQSILGRAYAATYRHRYPELWPLLTEMEKRAQSTGVSVADSIALLDHVIRNRPLAILELGAGQSSAVIALAIARAQRSNPTYRPQFVAVEESPEWLTHHREIIPAHLLSRIELTLCDTAARDTNGTRAAHYVGLPRAPYGFVHVDGPGMIKVGATVSCDVIDLLPELAPRCSIVFDGREASSRFARPHLERAGFRFRRHPFTLSHMFAREG